MSRRWRGILARVRGVDRAADCADAAPSPRRHKIHHQRSIPQARGDFRIARHKDAVGHRRVADARYLSRPRPRARPGPDRRRRRREGAPDLLRRRGLHHRGHEAGLRARAQAEVAHAFCRRDVGRRARELRRLLIVHGPGTCDLVIYRGDRRERIPGIDAASSTPSARPPPTFTRRPASARGGTKC